MKGLTAATDRLISCGANLGGEFDGTALTFTDSFTTTRFPLSGTSLLDPDGNPVTSQQALHQHLHPAPHLNAAGLTTGTVLTRLGLSRFHIKRTQTSQYKPAWELKLELSTERPLRLCGVMTEAVTLHTYAADHRPSYGDSRHVRMPGERGWRSDSELPDKLRAQLIRVAALGLHSLLTPAAAHAAQVAETLKRVTAAEADVARAQAALSVLRDEYAHLTQPHTA